MRKLVINEKKMKTLISNELGKKYKDISVDDRYGVNAIRVNKKQIPFTDKRILQALNLDVLHLEIKSVLINECNHHDPFNVNTTDEQKEYIFSCIEKCEA